MWDLGLLSYIWIWRSIVEEGKIRCGFVGKLPDIPELFYTLSRDKIFLSQSELEMSHRVPVLPHLKETVAITVAPSKAIRAPTMAMITAVLRSRSLVTYNSRSGDSSPRQKL